MAQLGGDRPGEDGPGGFRHRFGKPQEAAQQGLEKKTGREGRGHRIAGEAQDRAACHDAEGSGLAGCDVDPVDEKLALLFDGSGGKILGARR